MYCTCVIWNKLKVFEAIATHKMEVLFDCFFEETFARLERSGLQSRQKRRDVIDHLNAIILGSSKGNAMFVEYNEFSFKVN